MRLYLYRARVADGKFEPLLSIAVSISYTYYCDVITYTSPLHAPVVLTYHYVHGAELPTHHYTTYG